MHLKATVRVAVIAAAGIAGAVALTFPHVANAWDWTQLPAGYGVSSYQTICHTDTDPCVNGDGSTCNHVTISADGQATFSEADCVNPTFGQDVDAYIDSTVCGVNPVAGGSRCAPPASTDGATTTDTVTDTTPTPTATDPAVTVTNTETVTTAAPTTTSDTSSLEQRVSALEQRQAIDEARLVALEATSGQILGEDKSQTPFTRNVSP